MSERQRYGDGTSRIVYSYNDFRVEEISLPPQGKTEPQSHTSFHVGIVFKGSLTLYREWASGFIVEHYQEGEHFAVEAGKLHYMESGKSGVELIQTSSSEA